MGSFRDLKSPRAAWVILPAGLALAAYSGWRVWEEADLLARAAAVEAEVLDARVHEWTSGSAGNRERHYKPVVRFRYRVDGQEYESERVTPLDFGGSRQWASSLVADYPAGRAVTAWMDPARPDRAYLVKITAWKPRVGIGVGLLLAAFGGGVLWSARRREADAGS